MRFLLDTCVLSALRKSEENASLAEWISKADESDLFLSVITLGELEKGVSRLPESARKASLRDWIRRDVTERFAGRILLIDLDVARCWGELVGSLEKKGRRLPVLDAFIAATALANDCVIVTKNTKDFVDCGLRLLDP